LPQVPAPSPQPPTTAPPPPHSSAPSATATGTCATITNPDSITSAAYNLSPIPTTAICTGASRKVCVIIVVDDGDVFLAFGDPVAHGLLELYDLCRRDHLDALAPLFDVDLKVD